MKIRELYLKALRFIGYFSRYGARSALRLIASKARDTGSVMAIFSKTDVLGFYNFVRYLPFGENLDEKEVDTRTINWFIPPFGQGSGGHLNIFRFIHFLEKQGFRCNVIVDTQGTSSLEADVAKRQINDWFFKIAADVYVGAVNAPRAYFAVATGWQSAYAVRNFQSTIRKLYFVQDFEPYFYAPGSEYVFAEQTYRFGFVGLTAGTWLKYKLNEAYGMETHALSFSYDADRYRLMPRREPGIKRVFFYARPPTQRRAFELGLLVLDELTRRMPHVKVIFAGWDISGYQIPFEHLNAGVLTLDELPDLYNQCDAALVLSFSNLSLLPLELMACGTPVVSNKGPWVEWLLNNNNSILCDPTVEALVDGLVKVLVDTDLHAQIRVEGLKTVSSTSWEREAQKMGNLLSSLASD